ncbi:MAG: hypothetical protein ACRDV2_07885 [Actinomycetes bacterium]
MTSEPAPQQERLVDVHLLRYPLRVGSRANEHYEEVFREFALLASAELSHDVPTRMLALIDALGRRYARQEQHEIEREEALRRGEVSRDLTVHIPPSAADACRELDAMLDETDDFCRAGALLTLAPPADGVDFRRWYLSECIAQIDGRAAMAWPGALT